MAATVVQSVFASGVNTQTYNATIAAAGAGNLLVAIGAVNNVSVFGPNGGGSGVMIAGWTKDAGVLGVNEEIQVASKVAVGGETTLAIQHTSAGMDSSVWIVEVSGLTAPKDFAVTATGNCSGAGTNETPVTSGAFSTQDDFCVYGITGDGRGIQNPWSSATVDQGFVDPTTGTSTETIHILTGGVGADIQFVVAYGIKTGPTSFTVKFSGGNNNWFADVARAVVGYKVTGTGGGGQPLIRQAATMVTPR